MIQKTKVKKAFNKSGLQISADALNLLDHEMQLIVNKWVNNTKYGNVKRLSANLVWVALNRNYINKGGK
ncbi:MAG: hypothetical protein ACR2OP_07295 [Amylibacter sp.]